MLRDMILGTTYFPLQDTVISYLYFISNVIYGASPNTDPYGIPNSIELVPRICSINMINGKALFLDSKEPMNPHLIPLMLWRCNYEDNPKHSSM